MRTAEEEVDAIKAELLKYYAALDNREHGGVAADNCLDKIQGILGMHWRQGIPAELKKGRKKHG